MWVMGNHSFQTLSGKIRLYPEYEEERGDYRRVPVVVVPALFWFLRF
jgi:hypothetical protein